MWNYKVFIKKCKPLVGMMTLVLLLRMDYRTCINYIECGKKITCTQITRITTCAHFFVGLHKYFSYTVQSHTIKSILEFTWNDLKIHVHLSICATLLISSSTDPSEKLFFILQSIFLKAILILHTISEIATRSIFQSKVT